MEHNRNLKIDTQQIGAIDFQQRCKVNLVEKRQTVHKQFLNNWPATCRKTQFDVNLVHYTKFYTKQIVSKAEMLHYKPFRRKQR